MRPWERNDMDDTHHMIEQFDTKDEIRRYAAMGLVAGIVAVMLCVVSLMANARLFFQSWFFAVVFWTGISLGCLCLISFIHVVRPKWGLPIVRILEAGSRMIPYVALAFSPVLLFGMCDIHPWLQSTGVSDDMSAAKLTYLQTPFFALRWGIYFVIWTLLAYALSGWSYKQDVSGDLKLRQWRANLGVIAIFLLLITITVSMTDWVMSLNPNWSSSIFGFMMIASQVLGAFSLALWIFLIFEDKYPWNGCFDERTAKDLGNILLFLTLIWAYVSFSQYLLIWSADLPREISFYVFRNGGEWRILAELIVAFQFAVPFLMLLSNRTKRSRFLLGFVAGLLSLTGVLNLYWIVMPAFGSHRFNIAWSDLAAFVAVGGFWFFGMMHQLASRNLVPQNNDRIAEGDLEHARR
jgi:hypothetical protein